MGACVDGVEQCLPYLEPMLVLLAVGLISLDVFTFFKYVLPEVYLHTTTRTWHVIHLYWSVQHDMLAGQARRPGTTTVRSAVLPGSSLHPPRT